MARWTVARTQGRGLVQGMMIPQGIEHAFQTFTFQLLTVHRPATSLTRRHVFSVQDRIAVRYSARRQL